MRVNIIFYQMRIASSWFLLLLAVTQWVGGHLCYEVSYFIELQREMTALEATLAEEVQQETGVSSTVRVLEADEITPRGNFYGNFVFSKSLEDETIHYVVENESSLLTYEAVATASQENPSSDSDRTSLLKGLFKEFMIPAPELPVAQSAAHSTPNFHLLDFYQFTFTPRLSHPPDAA